MENKTIIKSADISAPAQKVWDVLVLDQYNRQWYAIFSEGTRAEPDWQQGSRVNFLDESGMGITGILTGIEPNNLIAIDYDGEVKDGKPDFESDMAKDMVGAQEIYRLTEANGATHLEVELTMKEEFIAMMDEQWDKALIKLKELAEN